jgi:hypothetical protein
VRHDDAGRPLSAVSAVTENQTRRFSSAIRWRFCRGQFCRDQAKRPTKRAAKQDFVQISTASHDGDRFALRCGVWMWHLRNSFQKNVLSKNFFCFG